MKMHVNLPFPISNMLEKKHSMFDEGNYDYHFDGVYGYASTLCKKLSSNK